jgi:2-keto-4-pentenoate hydratase/2-oxohepta-3-ene-1,7-dioic acid hydratase in catechol pathway
MARYAIPGWLERFGRPLPEKIVCAGFNSWTHAAEMGEEPPAAPVMFAKFPSALIGDGDPIVLPPEAGHVDAEAELAVVIGSRVRRVDPERAFEAVAGYLAANDVSARNLQFADGQWLRGKGFDTFCPVGPALGACPESPRRAANGRRRGRAAI